MRCVNFIFSLHACISLQGSADLKEPSSWKHHEPNLNDLGRVRKMPAPEDEAAEPNPDDEVEGSELLVEIKPEEW